MSKLTSSIVREVEQLTRLAAELSAETGRFMRVDVRIDLLTHEELHEVADELSVTPHPLLLGVTSSLDANVQSAQVIVESEGHYMLAVTFTSADDDELVYHRE